MTTWDEPPAFGLGGAVPPVQSEPVLLTEGYAVRIAAVPGFGAAAIKQLAGTENPSDAEMKSAREWLTENYTSKDISRLSFRAIASTYGRMSGDVLRWSFFPAQEILRRVSSSGESESFIREAALFRVRTYFYWQREDPLIRLVDGASGTITRKVVVGLSEAASHEITRSLGMEVNLPGGAGKISGQQAVKDAITLTRSEQHEEGRELTLPSPQKGTRRYAIWQRPVELQIDVLRTRQGNLFWSQTVSEVFNPAAALVATSDGDA